MFLAELYFGPDILISMCVLCMHVCAFCVCEHMLEEGGHPKHGHACHKLGLLITLEAVKEQGMMK